MSCSPRLLSFLCYLTKPLLYDKGEEGTQFHCLISEEWENKFEYIFFTENVLLIMVVIIEDKFKSKYILITAFPKSFQILSPSLPIKFKFFLKKNDKNPIQYHPQNQENKIKPHHKRKNKPHQTVTK